jgi:hypothetical protein
MTASEIGIGDTISFHQSDAIRPTLATVEEIQGRGDGGKIYIVRDHRRGWTHTVYSTDRTLTREA